MKTVMCKRFPYLKYVLSTMSITGPTPRVFKNFRVSIQAMWKRHGRKVVYK